MTEMWHWLREFFCCWHTEHRDHVDSLPVPMLVDAAQRNAEAADAMLRAFDDLEKALVQRDRTEGVRRG